MDMNNLPIALPSTSTSESAAAKYTFKHPFPQSFSIPYPIIKYMIQNPQSGKVWKKLILSCKYFYSKYPVYPVRSLNVYKMKCKADGKIFDSSKPFPKLWVYDCFSTLGNSSIAALIMKIFKFDLRCLFIDYQNLTSDDYQKLTSSGSIKILSLFDSEIKNADGSIVTADKLFENLHHLEEFTVCCRDRQSLFHTDTVKKMVHHLNGFQKLHGLYLLNLTESFHFADFADFLLKNETVYVNLYFYGHVSTAYKEMVKNVMKEIKKNPLLKVPEIDF